ncbi:MAG TPA: thiamine pyrophosphate-binding protein [Candidatus Hydrogenedentes bacterium]|nr:thiamine pyrophosphate-binding protein [Candidatus Hydrogenedentota bacterium]HOS01745.1 thiamine pyrophosphate-binding protein [Candidatus Hydrogenedentota bacterium]
MVKLSEYLFQRLAQYGVRHVFMLPGGGAMHLNDSLGRSGIGYTVNLHEQACGIAAEAYARVAHDLGVALVTTGPGGTNAVTGALAAYQDSTPCLFMSGQVKRPDIAKGTGLRQLGVQEVDIVSIVSSITKYAVTIMEPMSIRYHLEKALHLAKAGRPGPVWIDVPLDVQAAMIDETKLEGFTPPEAEETISETDLAAKLDAIIAALNDAERPMILAGNGVRIGGAQDAFLELVETLRVPVLTTRLGVDLIPAAHELSVGMPGSIASRGANFALQNADWLLMLGARMDFALIAYAPEKLARAAKKIMVNIDGPEIGKMGAAINIPVCADARAFIDRFQSRTDDVAKKDRSPWFARIRDWKQKYPFVLPEHRAAKDGLSMYAFSEALSNALTGDDIVLPGSAGFVAEIFLTAFQAKAGQRIFHNKGTGAMGLSQPAAIGACIAGNGRRTVCVDGDGGFQMNLQELETVKRLGLPIKFFVVNNQGYASIRSSQGNYFHRLTGADATSGLTLPDVTKIAAAYGIAAVRIDGASDLCAEIDRALAMPGPVVCDVVVIPDEARAPRVAAMQRPDGSMASKPLEDMWPFLDRDEFCANMIVPPLED